MSDLLKLLRDVPCGFCRGKVIGANASTCGLCAAFVDASAISDIHGGRDRLAYSTGERDRAIMERDEAKSAADELTRLMKKAYRERDEARAALLEMKRQHSAELGERANDFAREHEEKKQFKRERDEARQNARADLAVTKKITEERDAAEKRSAELEAALRRLCGSDDFRDCGMDAGMVYQRVEQIARAALSPAPAQPATATMQTTGGALLLACHCNQAPCVCMGFEPITLSPEAFAKVVEMIEKPAAPTEALKAVFRRDDSSSTHDPVDGDK